MTKNGLKRALSLLLSVIFVFLRVIFTGFRGGFQGEGGFGKQNRGWRGKEKTE